MKQNTLMTTKTVISMTALVLAFAGCDKISAILPGAKKEPQKTQAAPAPVAAVPAAESGPLAPDVVARVGNWTLTTAQFDQRLKLLKDGLPDFDASKPGNKEAVLNELIRQQLLVKDAEEQGLGAQKEIAEAVDDFRRTMLVQELANRLTRDVAADEKEAKDYYDQNKNLFVSPVQWTVREIVVADEAAAKAVLVQVLQGGDFAALAQAQSKGKTAANGGLLPVFTKAPFAAMQTAIASLDAGGTSSVFKGTEGYYIVKVDDKKGGVAKSFTEVKKDLIAGLTLRKQQDAVLAHIEQLSQKTKVEINKDVLGAGSTK